MSYPHFQKQVAQLPATAEKWELLAAPGPDDTDGAYVMLILSSDGPLLAGQPLDFRPDAQSLSVFVTMTCLAPEYGEPRRPAKVVIADSSVAAELSFELRSVGVKVQHGATPNAMDAYEGFLEFVSAPQVADSLVGYDDDAVRAYFSAAEEFYRSRPWEALRAEKFLAFRSEGRPWRYAGIMGHGGDEYGLAVYDNWLDACRMAYSHITAYSPATADEPPDPFVAVDGLEGVSLYPQELITPGDMEVIRRLRVRKTWKGQYAMVQRHTFEGADRALNALETYTAVMQVLAQRVDRARGRSVTSIKAQAETVYGPVDVVYPAKGTEDEGPDHYYLVEFADAMHVRGAAGRGVDGTFSGLPALVPGLFRAVAPGSAKWPKVVSALREVAKQAGYHDPYFDMLEEPDDLVILWFGHGSAVEPSPTVAQLASLDHVAIKTGPHSLRLTIKQVSTPAEPGISASWTETNTDSTSN